MTDEQIRQNAVKYSEQHCSGYVDGSLVDGYIAGAHSRNEEIYDLKRDIEDLQKMVKIRSDAFECARKEIDRLSNPWVTDRNPEIKGSISDAVLLLIDGLFYRVSRLERRKDGSEFWWGVDVANGEEVTAWMPIPELKIGGE